MSHDLVDLPVLLPTHKLLVLVGQLDLDAHLILGTADKWDLMNYDHGVFDSVVRTID